MNNRNIDDAGEDAEATNPRRKPQRRGPEQRIPVEAQHPKQVSLTAQEVRSHFANREEILAEEALAPLRKQFSSVDKLILERDQLKSDLIAATTELEALKGKVDDLVAKVAANQESTANNAQ